jgi:transcriptional regulator with XRE-family HTH domain
MEDILIDGAKMRQFRKNKGWSQFGLARVALVDQGTISALERNARAGLRLNTLVRLARALGVSTDDLIVPSDGVPVEPSDPQLNVMMHLVVDMTTEERKSAEEFIRFVLAQRRRLKQQAKKQDQPDEKPKTPTARTSRSQAKRKE